MYQNEDAIRNALERAAVVSRNGVFCNLVHTPCTTIGIEICTPMHFSPAIEIREKLGARRWQWELYSYAAIARCILKRTIVLHLDLEYACFENRDCVSRKVFRDFVFYYETIFFGKVIININTIC